MEKRKFGKRYTVIDGITKEANMDEIIKQLKTKFACGGTVKRGSLELQGDHRPKVKEALVNLGFAEETIEVR